MPSNHRRLAPISLVLVLAACSNRVDPEDVPTWANAGSALGVYTHLHTPVGFALGEASFGDPACPVTDDDGTTVRITGGCTDSEGKHFEGEIVITRVDGPRDLDLTFSDYGSGEDEDALARTTGTASVRQLDGSAYSYDVELVNDGLAKLDIDYSGTIVGDFGQPTVFNGSGRLIRSGFGPNGTAEVSTVDQLVDDDVCSGQSVSGETTIEVDGHVIVVTYDGETDCDEDHAARWSLDGKDQGLVEGITCAVDSSGRASDLLWALMLLGLGAARSRRRPSR
jgi:MYXO-CTERM domain-containing protein